ncbi:AsnC family transcriptional regulator [Rhodospirillum rubrum]|uniref:Lrp/AsnC family transcriptional regulator n=1 Tax=Rhodospirillum rubrum TaxID=1085 RepID=UPI0019089528|nr:Lrp/AsnC family transcriptional regulator [Rhodospirillum rubrum]MBK1665886.1 AsnC family transcriptional regulator [Rhodospirillum rubrum]MBK1677999.1 AsnC family transcriptional regulator [Rhodospirillum rubrum]
MPKSDLDATDRRILAALQRDGRLSNVELAQDVALSPSPCLRRVRRLEDEGVIRGYRADLDRLRVGLGLTVYMELKVGLHSRANAEGLAAALAAMPEVVSCAMVSGDADFVAEVVVPDLERYERFLTEHIQTLPMIASIRSNFALRTLKSAGPLPLPAA